jgi:DNA-binding transcriptional ArsR family regulator
LQERRYLWAILQTLYKPTPPTEILDFLKKTLIKICECGKLFLNLQPIGCINKMIGKMRRDVFQAIADPTRRAIIALIALQAMTPNAIADNFNSTRQAVSKHLHILVECELVKQENQGREIYYSLKIEKMKEIDNWLKQYRKIWEKRFDQLDNILSTMKGKKK